MRIEALIFFFNFESQLYPHVYERATSWKLSCHDRGLSWKPKVLKVASLCRQPGYRLDICQRHQFSGFPQDLTIQKSWGWARNCVFTGIPRYLWITLEFQNHQLQLCLVRTPNTPHQTYTFLSFLKRLCGRWTLETAWYWRGRHFMWGQKGTAVSREYWLSTL